MKILVNKADIIRAPFLTFVFFVIYLNLFRKFKKRKKKQKKKALTLHMPTNKKKTKTKEKAIKHTWMNNYFFDAWITFCFQQQYLVLCEFITPRIIKGKVVSEMTIPMFFVVCDCLIVCYVLFEKLTNKFKR